MRAAALPATLLHSTSAFKADSSFTRDGDDLHCWIQVPMSWAVLGHDLSIDTFDGEKTRVHPGRLPD